MLVFKHQIQKRTAEMVGGGDVFFFPDWLNRGEDLKGELVQSTIYICVCVSVCGRKNRNDCLPVPSGTL